MQFNELPLNSNLEQAKKYLIQRKNNKAIKHLYKILDEFPLEEEAWLLLGIANRRKRKLKNAIKCFKTVCEINSSMVQAWGMLTITYLDNGNYSSAQETLHKAILLNPNSKKIKFYYNNLIRVYEKFGPFF